MRSAVAARASIDACVPPFHTLESVPTEADGNVKEHFGANSVHSTSRKKRATARTLPLVHATQKDFY